MQIPAGKRRSRLRIEQPAPDDALDGAGSGSWTLLARVWAELLDVLPSRDERSAEGMTSSTRRARVRIQYREGITAEMRFVLGSRVMQIVGGPAEIGRREGLEFMVEDYRPAGNPA